MHNDVTRIYARDGFRSQWSRRGKIYFKMATVEDECFEVLNCLLAAIQANEDSSSFENSCTGAQRLDNPESQCSGQSFPSISTKQSGGAGGYTCCVPGCSSNNKKSPELSFYNFPNGKSKESIELRKRWINLISRKDFSPTIGHRVCSLHFPGGRKTYMNRLPTIVPKATRPTPTKPRSTVKVRNRAPLLARTKTVPAKRRLFSELDDTENNLPITSNESNIITSPHKENTDPIACLQKQMAKLVATNEQLKDENAQLKNESECQKVVIRDLTIKLEDEVKRKQFSIECFKGNDNLIRFYTGLEDYKTFKTLFDSFGPAVNNLVYYGTKTNSERLKSDKVVKRGPKRSSTPEQEFFLVLVRLRLGLLEEDLATRCGLSQSQMSRIFITWVDFLHSRLRTYPIWPTRESIHKTMPAVFKAMYPSTRVIIDCTEIFIERPSSFQSQSATYSTYKSHNTAKGLVGISPSGAVTFVSDLYVGRSSDKQVTVDCGIFDLLAPGDSIMADRGFDIEDILPNGVSLNIPPFMRNKEFLSIEEETETRRIASVRIHVERAIARIKNFRILSTVFPISMGADLNKIWVICCYLSNFLPPLIIENAL